MKALRATTSRYAFRSACSGVAGTASSLLTQRSSQSAATRIAIWSMHRPGATSPVVACSRRSYASMEKPPRDARYTKLEERDVQHFRSIVADPQASVVTDPDALAPLNEDWLHKYRGYSKYYLLVLFIQSFRIHSISIAHACRLGLQPRTVEEVARILKYCNERKLAVVPQGGNTGLVGGSVPVHDGAHSPLRAQPPLLVLYLVLTTSPLHTHTEIILSMSKMNKVLSFDPVSGVLTCEVSASFFFFSSSTRRGVVLKPQTSPASARPDACCKPWTSTSRRKGSPCPSISALREGNGGQSLHLWRQR